MLANGSTQLNRVFRTALVCKTKKPVSGKGYYLGCWWINYQRFWSHYWLATLRRKITQIWVKVFVAQINYVEKAAYLGRVGFISVYFKD
jgi:hypothetical protein